MELKGKLIVTMRFEVPVNERMYAATLRDKGNVTVEDILTAEEQNYLADNDTYLSAILDNVTEVSFSFEPTKERWDDRPAVNR